MNRLDTIRYYNLRRRIPTNNIFFNLKKRVKTNNLYFVKQFKFLFENNNFKTSGSHPKPYDSSILSTVGEICIPLTNFFR